MLYDVIYDFDKTCLREIFKINSGDMLRIGGHQYVVIACIIAPPMDRLHQFAKVILRLRRLTEPQQEEIGAFDLRLNRDVEDTFKILSSQVNLINVHSSSYKENVI